jgi:hypothetical protein
MWDKFKSFAQRIKACFANKMHLPGWGSYTRVLIPQFRKFVSYVYPRVLKNSNFYIRYNRFSKQLDNIANQWELIPDERRADLETMQGDLDRIIDFQEKYARNQKITKEEKRELTALADKYTHDDYWEHDHRRTRKNKYPSQRKSPTKKYWTDANGNQHPYQRIQLRGVLRGYIRALYLEFDAYRIIVDHLYGGPVGFRQWLRRMWKKHPYALLHHKFECWMSMTDTEFEHTMHDIY